jgi:flagellar basal body rod protein FlgC
MPRSKLYYVVLVVALIDCTASPFEKTSTMTTYKQSPYRKDTVQTQLPDTKSYIQIPVTNQVLVEAVVESVSDEPLE